MMIDILFIGAKVGAVVNPKTLRTDGKGCLKRRFAEGLRDITGVSKDTLP